MPKVKPLYGESSFEDKELLKLLNSIFINKRSYIFRFPKKNQAVVLLLSGGMDSVCLWYLLTHVYKLHVYPLHFSSPLESKGQTASLNYFSRFMKKFTPSHFHPITTIPDDSLFSAQKELKTLSYAHDAPFIVENLVLHTDTKQARIHNINNPGRLGRFAFRAYEYALKLRYQNNLDISTIFTGVMPDDSTIVRESTLTVLRSINLSLCLILGDFRWQFTAPFEKNFYYTKASLLRKLAKMKFPFEKTWSCDRKGSIHCGICLSCRHRKEIFKQARIPDRTGYALFSSILPSLKKTASILRRQQQQKQPASRPFKKTDIFLVRQGIYQYKSAEKTYLLNENNGVIRELNSTASEIYELIRNNNMSVIKLSDKIHKKYDIPLSKALKDTHTFVKSLLSDGFLRVKLNKE